MRRRLTALLGSLTWLSRLHPDLEEQLYVPVSWYQEVVDHPETGERVDSSELTYQQRQRFAAYLSYEERESEVRLYVKMRDGSVLLPRRAVSPGQLDELGYEVQFSENRSEVVPDLYEASERIVLRNDVQREAFESVYHFDAGFLQLAPGKGKTVIALKAAARRSRPVLVFVDNGGLLTQWKERICQFWGIPASEIGEVQSHASRWTWEGRPITLAIYNSFFQQYQHGNIPRAFFDYFGTVIWDEAQTAKSPSHFPTLSLFNAHRLGLSATPGRDGTERILFAHTGPPEYVNLESDLVPDCFFEAVELARPKEFTRKGKERYGKMATYCLGGPKKKPDANYVSAVRERIEELRSRGRKILVVTPRSGFGREFTEAFPDSVVIDQSTAFEDRDHLLNSTDLVFVTTQLGERALDRPDLDALVLVYPVGKNAQDRASQSMGRILRLSEGKPSPEAYSFYPDNGYGRELARANENLFRALGYRVPRGVPRESRSPSRARIKKAVIPRREDARVRDTGQADAGGGAAPGASGRKSALSRLRAGGNQ